MDYTDATGRGLSREHLAALDVLRHAKNVFFWLVIVAVALHVAAWIVVRHTDALRPLQPLIVYGGDEDGVGQPIPTEDQLIAAGHWKVGIGWALALAGFVGRASALVVTGVMLLSLLVSLSARLGGAADLAKSFVWALAALAMLVPWLRAPEEAAALASAFYGLEDLSSVASGEDGAAGGVLSVVRFLVCPIMVAVFLLVAQHRFRRAYAQITAAPGAKLPIHEV